MNRHLLGMLEEEIDAGPVQSDEHATNESTQGLRIAAVFIILLAGLLGGLPPLFIKAFQRQESLPTFLIRAFSAGVILALALVHIVPDAIEDLIDIGGVQYPVGGTSILFGIAAMIFIEHGAHMMYGMPHGHHSDAVPTVAAAVAAGPPLLLPQPSDEAEGAEGEELQRCDGDSNSMQHQHAHAHGHAHGHTHTHAHAHGSKLAQGRAACASALPPSSPQERQQQPQSHPRHQHSPPQQQQNSLKNLLLTPSSSPAPVPAGGGRGGGMFVRRSAGPSLCHRGGDFEAAAAGAGAGGPQLAACSLPSPLLSSSDCTIARLECSTPGGDGDGGSGGGDGGASAASTALLLHCQPDHCHDCVSRSSAPNWASAVEVSAAVDSPLRLRILAYLFELGCIFHSFIIGLSLGVNRTSISQVRALLIALSFHQALEGLSLASVINRGGFSGARAALMVAMYGATCPAGVAIGIAIAESYESESLRARAAQGVLNGVSGGMLLYISLVQLIAEDMGKYVAEPTAHKPHGDDGPTGHSGCHSAGGSGISYRIRMPSFLAFCAGAASMCVLAVWA